MLKKIFFIIFCSVILHVNVYADDGNGTAISKPVSKPALNNPAVGARAGSNQLFGYQKPVPKGDGNNADKKNGNRPTVGSRAGSEQVFGNQKIITKNASDNKSDDKKIGLNRPSVGSRSGSEQIFGHP